MLGLMRGWMIVNIAVLIAFISGIWESYAKQDVATLLVTLAIGLIGVASWYFWFQAGFDDYDEIVNGE